MPFDQQFIDMMVPHHEASVAMAKVAEERADHAEIKDFAADMISAQGKEISELRAWRKEWFGSDQTPGMDAMPMLPGMKMSGGSMSMPLDVTSDVEALKTAEPFDTAFIEAMAKHHETAIEAAKVAQDKAERDEIKRLAGKIISTQGAEVARMAAWKADWA